VEGRDPDILRNSANFGHALYVVRYDGKVIGKDFQNIFKDFITNEPGLKLVIIIILVIWKLEISDFVRDRYPNHNGKWTGKLAMIIEQPNWKKKSTTN
jgi:hypothetical protein